MNLKPVQIQMDPNDIQKVLGIALDDDKEKALRIVKEFVKRLQIQVGKGLKSHLAG